MTTVVRPGAQHFGPGLDDRPGRPRRRGATSDRRSRSNPGGRARGQAAADHVDEGGERARARVCPRSVHSSATTGIHARLRRPSSSWSNENRRSRRRCSSGGYGVTALRARRLRRARGSAARHRPFGSTRPNSLRLYALPSPSKAQPWPGHTSSSPRRGPRRDRGRGAGSTRGALRRRPSRRATHELPRRRPRPRIRSRHERRFRAAHSSSPSAERRARSGRTRRARRPGDGVGPST